MPARLPPCAFRSGRARRAEQQARRTACARRRPERRKLEAAELFQQFGFTSGVPAGSELIVLPLGGKTAHSVIVATENGAYRVQVGGGEVCVYNQWGAKITLKKKKDHRGGLRSLYRESQRRRADADKSYTVQADAGVTYQTPGLPTAGPPAAATPPGAPWPASPAICTLTARSRLPAIRRLRAYPPHTIHTKATAAAPPASRSNRLSFFFSR